MFQYAMFLQGIDYNELNILDVGEVHAIDEAWRAGQGAYVHQQGPFAQQLEADGLGVVVTSVGEIVGPVAFSSLCATQSWLDTPIWQVPRGRALLPRTTGSNDPGGG